MEEDILIESQLKASSKVAIEAVAEHLGLVCPIHLGITAIHSLQRIYLQVEQSIQSRTLVSLLEFRGLEC